MKHSIPAAVAIAALLLTAGPSQAQLIHRNTDGTLSINPLLCFTDYQVRQAVAAAGYGHISLYPPNESHRQVKATRGGHTYLLDFNICTGHIVGAERLR